MGISRGQNGGGASASWFEIAEKDLMSVWRASPVRTSRKASSLRARLLASGALILGLIGQSAFAQASEHAQIAAFAEGSDAAAVTTDAEVEGITVIGAGAPQAAQAKLEEVAGGVSVIDSAVIDKGRVFTNQDLLAFQPGVFAQSAAGADGLKISIRGSAINRGANFFRTGVLLMFDGLPVNGPGGAPYELFEPLGLSYTEILRGANANALGATALGGAINYVTKTGYDADRLQLRIEGGSFNYEKYQLSSGQVIGPWDYYVSFTASGRDGFQRQSEARSAGVSANVGYRFSDNLDTRLYFRYRETTNYTPGALTQAEVRRDPTLANPVNIAQNTYRRQPGSTWVASRTTWTPDDKSQLVVGFAWHDYPIDINGGVNRAIWAYTDVSAMLRYTREHTLFGRDSVTTVGFLGTTHLNGYQHTIVRIPAGPTAGLPVGTLIRRANYDGSDHVIHLDNNTDLTPELTLSTGLSAIHIVRSTDVSYPEVNLPYKRDDWDYAPRIGLLYRPNDNLQVFGNISRSVEPQNDWALLTTPPAFTSGPATGLAKQALDLKDQTAISYEIGTRGTAWIGQWSLSLYRAEIKNELLSVEVQPATSTQAAITAESNASPTVHQGVEASLTSVLWESKGGHRLSARQSYTYNDFFFKDDPKFGENELPGVPRHFYQAGLTYDHPSGFYASLSLDYASSYYVDYANSVEVKPYTLLGATFGYEPPEADWQVFVDFRNITDEHYVSSVNTFYDDKGLDARRYNPGDGFSVSGGLSVSF